MSATDAPAAPAAAAPAAPAAPAPAAAAAPPVPAPLPPAALPPAVTAPPPEMQLTVKQGVNVPPEYLSNLRALAGKHGISQAQAQAVLDDAIARSAAAAQTASDNERTLRGSYEMLLQQQYPGPALAAATDRITAYLKTRLPTLSDHVLGQTMARHPELFTFLDGLAKAATETGTIKTPVAPAHAATADPNDMSALFTHRDSKAAMAAEVSS